MLAVTLRVDTIMQHQPTSRNQSNIGQAQHPLPSSTRITIIYDIVRTAGGSHDGTQLQMDSQTPVDGLKQTVTAYNVGTDRV